MKKFVLIALCVGVLASLAMAQTYKQGSGLVGYDKLGAHQNGGRGCVGCHAPHSGARGNGGNAMAGGAVTDPTTGNVALWGQDIGPLYNKTLVTGGGDFSISMPGIAESHTDEEEQLITGVMMCLSCHDGQVAKGAMMTNQAYEQTIGVLGSGYGTGAIKTLLGDDGTSAGNYKNDHPIGPAANLKAVGVASNLILKKASDNYCSVHGAPAPCLIPNTTKTNFMAFVDNYGAFNITQSTKEVKDGSGNVIVTAYSKGGRTTGVVIPSTATSADQAYVICTTCHTPHSMYTFSGNAGADVLPATGSNVYPTYFFVSAPYNPKAPITDGKKASSATQFCRQCHFTGAGGSNEGSGILTVGTSF
ncbi:MAG TPA: hypothetical protein VD837_04975 [Terriglobales bacterium]|nr:hypothetical protein [Terriglobales bacterium]